MDGRLMRADHRWTSLALTVGTTFAGACLAIGLLLTVLGADRTAHDPRELALVLRSAAELRPWGWSMLGVIALIATPALGLLATFFELRARQPRVALLALAVLAILGLATVIAAR